MERPDGLLPALPGPPGRARIEEERGATGWSLPGAAEPSWAGAREEIVGGGGWYRHAGRSPSPPSLGAGALGERGGDGGGGRPGGRSAELLSLKASARGREGRRATQWSHPGAPGPQGRVRVEEGRERRGSDPVVAPRRGRALEAGARRRCVGGERHAGRSPAQPSSRELVLREREEWEPSDAPVAFSQSCAAKLLRARPRARREEVDEGGRRSWRGNESRREKKQRRGKEQRKRETGEK